jgi:hypothetical protein
MNMQPWGRVVACCPHYHYCNITQLAWQNRIRFKATWNKGDGAAGKRCIDDLSLCIMHDAFSVPTVCIYVCTDECSTIALERLHSTCDFMQDSSSCVAVGTHNYRRTWSDTLMDADCQVKLAAELNIPILVIGVRTPLLKVDLMQCQCMPRATVLPGSCHMRSGMYPPASFTS